MAKGRKPLSDDQKRLRGDVALEVEYERIFGERRFSEYDSLRGSVGGLKRLILHNCKLLYVKTAFEPLHNFYKYPELLI